MPAQPKLTSKGRATRDRIVSVASELMHRKGVTATSVEDVRTAAGVSMSQIYHYFADKEGLTRAVVAHQGSTVLGLQHSLLHDVDGIAGLRAWRDAIVAYKKGLGGAGGCPIGTLAAELAETDQQARADLARWYELWGNDLAAGLRRMRESGQLRPDADSEALSLALLATLQGGLLLAQTRRDTVALEAALDSMIDHVASFAP